MAIVDNALHALTDEVVIPRSGWEREPNEDSKPRHIEWESVLTNTAGCLRYGTGAAGSWKRAGAGWAAVTLLPGWEVAVPQSQMRAAVLSAAELLSWDGYW